MSNREYIKQGLTDSEYASIHYWLKSNYGVANVCESKECQGNSNNYDWALKNNHTYDRKRDNFIMLCRSCHFKYDFTESKRTRLKNANLNTIKKHKWVGISQFNLKGELIRTFDNVITASKELNIIDTAITNNLKGRSKTCGGFIFKYK